MSFNRRIDIENMQHLHNGILLGRLKDEISEVTGKLIELEKSVILNEAGIPDPARKYGIHLYMYSLIHVDIRCEDNDKQAITIDPQTLGIE